MIRAIVIRTLIMWLWFGGLSAILGGVLGVFTNGAGVPFAYLRQSPFTSSLIPGLLVGLVIGGTQLTAAILIQRRNPWALPASVIAALGIIVWIFVELAVAHEFSPLQVVYLALGVGEIVLVLLALGLLAPFRVPVVAPTIPPAPRAR